VMRAGLSTPDRSVIHARQVVEHKRRPVGKLDAAGRSKTSLRSRRERSSRRQRQRERATGVRCQAPRSRQRGRRQCLEPWQKAGLGNLPRRGAIPPWRHRSLRLQLPPTERRLPCASPQTRAEVRGKCRTTRSDFLPKS
jgi:hypothetical protein